MAYCPECQQIVSIVMNTQGSYEEVRVKSERYVIHEGMDHHVGHDESFQPVATTSSTPHCSNCFAILEFPQATAREGLEKKEREIFESVKSQYINRVETLRRSVSTGHSLCQGDADRSTFAEKDLNYSMIAFSIISIIVALFKFSIGLILGLFFFCLYIWGKIRNKKEMEANAAYTLETTNKSLISIETRLTQLNRLGQYTHENYKKMKEIERTPIY